MFVCLVLIISRLDRQKSFRFLHYFPVAILVDHQMCSNIAFSVICKFLQNISTNLCSLRKRIALKRGELSN